MAPRKKAAKPLKKDQYRCVGGPVDRMYLPGLERGDYKTALPDEVHFDDGHYARRYDPTSDTSYYDWTDR